MSEILNRDDLAKKREAFKERLAQIDDTFNSRSFLDEEISTLKKTEDGRRDLAEHYSNKYAQLEELLEDISAVLKPHHRKKGLDQDLMEELGALSKFRDSVRKKKLNAWKPLSGVDGARQLLASKIANLKAGGADEGNQEMLKRW